MLNTTTIKIHRDTYDKLAAMKPRGMSFDLLITNLIEKRERGGNGQRKPKK